METDPELAERIQAAIREEVEIAPYDARWPLRFEEECARLRALLPRDLLGRIEHFGSTAVPQLAAKPIIDMLVEVASLERARVEAAPILQTQGYDYFWRPTIGESPPFYAWFIRRDDRGRRTHHIHMIEKDFEHWERLRFRDWLIAHPDSAAAYQSLKFALARQHPQDRAAYTQGKSAFIAGIVQQAQAEADQGQR